MRGINPVLKAPLLWGVLFLVAAYLVVAISTEPPTLLLAQNAVLTGLSLGVVVAYAPAGWSALRSVKPRQGELLALGIFLAWLGTFIVRVIGMLRYGLNDPSFFGTDFSTASAFLIGLAAICHLMAPEAIDGWLPKKAGVISGAWIAAGLAALALLIFFA
jgi:hypothetical protein